MSDGEVWKDVPGHGGHYEASSFGRIRVKQRVVFKGHRTGRNISQTYKPRLLSLKGRDKYGHISVHIGVGGVKYSVFVHRLVLLAFVGPQPEGMECCHNNGIAFDNRPENLRWDTHFNNNGDRKKHGNYAVGEKHCMAKISNLQAVEIYEKLKDGRTGVSLAREYAISSSQVSRINKGRHGALLAMGIAGG